MYYEDRFTFLKSVRVPIYFYLMPYTQEILKSGEVIYYDNIGLVF